MDGIVSLVEEFYSIKFTINLPEHAGERQLFSETVFHMHTPVWRIIPGNGIRMDSNSLQPQSGVSPYFVLLTNLSKSSSRYCSYLSQLQAIARKGGDALQSWRILLPVPMKKVIGRSGDEFMCEFIVTDNENVQYAYSLYLYRVPEGKILSQHQYFAPETLHALGTFIANASNFISECPAIEDSEEVASIVSLDQFVDALSSSVTSSLEESSNLQKLFDPELKSLLQSSCGPAESDHNAAKSYQEELAQLATNMKQVIGVETFMRRGPGNFTADKIATNLNSEGRPALVGICGFEWGSSSRMDDLALAMLSVFKIDKDINRCPLLQAKEILKGYVAIENSSKEEIQSLWPIIILRGIEYLMKSTRFEKSEMYSAAKETLKRILEIPFNIAQTMMTAAAGHLPTVSSRSGLGPEIGGKFEPHLPTQWMDLDLTVTSSIYPSRWQDWFASSDTEEAKDELERRLIDYAVELNHLRTQMEAVQARYPNPKPSSSSSSSSSSPMHESIVFTVVSYGTPLLYRSKVPSMVAPTNIPLYSKIVFNAQYNRIHLSAPFGIADIELDVITHTSDGEEKIRGGAEVAGWTSIKYQRANEQSILIRTPQSEDTDILISVGKTSGATIHILPENKIDYVFAPGSHFAAIEFPSSSARSRGVSVQLIPKPGLYAYHCPSCQGRGNAGDSALCKEFLPPKHCSEQYFDTYRRLCPNPNEVLLRLFSSYHELDLNSPPLVEVVPAPPSVASPLALRYEHLAAMQEHYFSKRMNVRGEPAIFLRGSGAYMFDSCGRAYLDMVNNVALVGHSHHLVVSAAAEQNKLLNTNSRFIYPSLGLFTSKVTQLMNQAVPLREQGRLESCGEKKWVVFLVNSGSEATDLALRIARSVANHRRMVDNCGDLNRNVISLCGGYHGVTTASDEVSTTLNDNPRSLLTRPPWIHLVPLPNMYRGLHRLPLPYMYQYSQLCDSARAKIAVSEEDYCRTRSQLEEEVAEKYADYVRTTCSRLSSMGAPPCAFICEPLSGNAGGVLLPQGYLRKVYHEVRKVGGFCICDVVQVGYGRLSTAGASGVEGFWGFEEHGVCPDIVTMAKAAGNGHPLGFVLVQSDIAEDFKTCEGSFFSSAGGGPVSCTVGLAVLQAIEQDNLQANAAEVGEYLNKTLISLSTRYPNLIGCIHGHGLYQGIEIVDSSKISSEDEVEDGVLPPGSDVAYAVCDRLRELGVLCHGTGDYSNVLKVKPPMCFSKADADFFLTALTRCCEEGW